MQNFLWQVRRHKILIAFSVVYILSIAALCIAVSQQDHVTKVNRHVDQQIIQKLDAGKVCRENSPGFDNTMNCRALIQRLMDSSTKEQRRRLGIRLISQMTPEDLKKLGVQTRSP